MVANVKGLATSPEPFYRHVFHGLRENMHMCYQFKATNGSDDGAPTGDSDVASGLSGTEAGVVGASSVATANRENAINVWLAANREPIERTSPIGGI